MTVNIGHSGSSLLEDPRSIQGSSVLKKSTLSDEPIDMGAARPIRNYDDELHERRREMAVVRAPIDFEKKRLQRLQERSRDTRDP